MESYKDLLLGNQTWIKEKLKANANYFEKMAAGQQPHFLWIGCSDSRVPANEITGSDAGDIFVHRNIANLVVHTDFNMLSVLQFAVEALKVNNIIVCGHYGCGGIQAAMSHTDYGLMNKWLQHIKDIYRLNEGELNAIADEEKRADRLVELNVDEQVYNLAETSIVQRAWKDRKGPIIHGWIFDLKTGKLNEHTKLEAGTPLNDIYRLDFDDTGDFH